MMGNANAARGGSPLLLLSCRRGSSLDGGLFGVHCAAMLVAVLLLRRRDCCSRRRFWCSLL